MVQRIIKPQSDLTVLGQFQKAFLLHVYLATIVLDYK